MMISRVTRAVAIVGFVAGISASSNAVLLLPGDGATPLPGTSSSLLPDLTGGTLLASLTTSFSNSSYAGFLHTSVIRETTGTLTFLYQLSDTAGPNFIRRLTTVDYMGFTTDVDYFSDAFTGFGYVAGSGVSPYPHTGDRNTGDVIGFNFQMLPNDLGLQGGDVTNVMYIRTNAVNYTGGFSNVIDGNVERVASFAPTSSVPGPAAVIPMAIGLLGALLRRRRR